MEEKKLRGWSLGANPIGGHFSVLLCCSGANWNYAANPIGGQFDVGLELMFNVYYGASPLMWV